MRELGRVVRIEGEKGIIKLEARGGCRNCGINSFCRSTGTGERELKIDLGPRRVEPGDLVEIETRARTLLTAAFLVFIMPIILSVAAYIIIYSLTKRPNLGVAGFFGCFFASEFLIAWIDRSFGKRRFFEPLIVRINQSQVE